MVRAYINNELMREFEIKRKETERKLKVRISQEKFSKMITPTLTPQIKNFGLNTKNIKYNKTK